MRGTNRTSAVEILRAGGWLDEHYPRRLVQASAGGEDVYEIAGCAVITQHLVRVRAADVQIPVRPEQRVEGYVETSALRKDRERIACVDVVPQHDGTAWT